MEMERSSDMSGFSSLREVGASLTSEQVLGTMVHLRYICYSLFRYLYEVPLT